MKKFIALIIAMITATSVLANPVAFDPVNRTIEIIVPYPPGGATDKWGRVVAEMFAARGWRAMVINRPGGDTVIASNYVAQARPDGHTLYIGGNGFLDANLAFKQKPAGIEYTPDSFTPIMPLGAGTAVLAVANNVPVKNFLEFRNWVRRNPEKFNLGFWNSYTANVFMVWADRENIPRPNMVFYKGSAPQVADLVGGHIPFAFDTYTALAPHVAAGKVKIIATMDTKGPGIVQKDQPSLLLPAIGERIGIMDVSIWYGLYGPAGMQPDVVQQISTTINSALTNAKYRDQVESLHISNLGGTALEQRMVQQKTLNIMRQAAQTLGQ